MPNDAAKQPQEVSYIMSQWTRNEYNDATDRVLSPLIRYILVLQDELRKAT